MPLSHITDSASLDYALSEPSDELVAAMSEFDGDILILGAGGKMGPSTALMARRASDAASVPRRIIAVSRFSNDVAAAALQNSGVEVIRGDLFDARFVESLPTVTNVLHMVGMKFGGPNALADTWASNVYLAGVIANRFRASRIVAMSTGNVYGLSRVNSGNGSAESEVPNPIGEYGMQPLGRERIFQSFSATA